MTAQTQQAAPSGEPGIQVRAFDAASRRDRTSGWHTTGASANNEIGPALNLLRDRCRDLARNDAYISRAMNVIRTNVVGTGIRPSLDGEQPIEARWKQWADTPACDADGVHDLYGLQGLAMRAVAESGEVLIRWRPRRTEDNLPVPLQLQIIEADHLDTSKDGVADRNSHRWVQGVEFDGRGKRVAYWIHRNHPGDRAFAGLLESVRVPADQILHLYRVDRPGQVRGVPWAAPVAIRTRELKDYEDAQLLRQKIAACFAAFEHDSPYGAEDLSKISPAGGGEGSESDGSLGDEMIEPGMIHRLAAGKTVAFSQPPSIQNYDEFVKRQLRAIAVGLGLSYEALAGDLQGVSFSSGRMGHLEFQRNIQSWQASIMITQFCRPVWGWFLEAAKLMGERVPGVDHSWITPRREMIDPTREVPATIAAIRGGLGTLTDAIRAMGKDPEEVFRTLARERALLAELGLTVESDPSMAKEWRMPDTAQAPE
jgi:lambda family phage portal protein